MKEGWTWLINSKREHYFRNGKSLCGKWACLGNDFTEYPGGIPCATCLKKREKEEEEIKDLLELVDSQFDGDDIIGFRDCKELKMGCKDCECLKRKIAKLQRDNAALREQLHRYAKDLEMRQNTAWMVEELIRRCPRREMNIAELVAYKKPEMVPDWEEIEITNNYPLQRIQLEEIQVCFHFNRFRK